jgi:hypothetical protein
MFTVDLKCKPYIYQFTKHFLGNPADISMHKDLQLILRALLHKPSRRYEYRDLSCQYSCNIKLLISQEDFNRYGCHLNTTSTIALNKYLSGEAKKLLHTSFTWLTINRRKNISVLEFQDRYGFNEDIWSYEAIIKELQRNHPDTDTETLDMLVDRMLEKNLALLSLKRTNVLTR